MAYIDLLRKLVFDCLRVLVVALDGLLQRLEIQLHLLLRPDVVSNVSLVLLNHLFVLGVVVGTGSGYDGRELGDLLELSLLGRVDAGGHWSLQRQAGVTQALQTDGLTAFIVVAHLVRPLKMHAQTVLAQSEYRALCV